MSEPNDPTRAMLTLSPGTSVGRYEIKERLGAGGMGEVFLAWDPSLKRSVAIKFPPAHLTEDTAYRARLEREAQAMAGIEHSNIVHIFDMGEHQGRPYVVMEHVVGETLQQVLEGGALSTQSAVRCGKQLAEALAQAHNLDVLHRDIKPSNIMVDAHGKPKLLDFGLATLPVGEPLTQVGSTVGTIGYMAPEVVQGKPATPAADLFSLGVVLFSCLTGARPFAGDNAATVMNAVLNKEPEWPSEREVPSDLRRLVDRMLSKDPGARPQSAGEVAAALGPWASETTMAVPIARAPRRGWWKGTAAAVLLVAVALAALWLKPWENRGGTISSAEASVPKLVVLPFENLSGGDRQDPMGEVMSSLIITDLSQATSVSVLSNAYVGEVIRRLGGAPDVGAVAAETHAQLVVIGKVLQREPVLIITSQLIDTGDGRVVDAQRVQGTEGQTVFDVVDALTAHLRKKLGLRGSDSETKPIAEATTQSVEAYSEFISGFRAYELFKFEEAVGHLERAVSLDSEFAMAWMMLARVYERSRRTAEVDTCVTMVKRHLTGVTPRERLMLEIFICEQEDNRDLARELADRLAEEYPADPYSWLIAGFAHLNSLDAEANKRFEEAVRLDPNLAAAYNQLAYGYESLGDFDRSLWAINEYIRLKPDEANPYDSRGDLYAYSGRLEEAQASYLKALEVDPDFWTSQVNLIWMSIYLEEYARAEELIREAMGAPSPRARQLALLAYCALPVQQGRFREGLERLEKTFGTEDLMAESGSSEDRMILKADILLYLGDAQGALEAAEAALQEVPTGWGNEYKAIILSRLGRNEEARRVLDQSPNPERDVVRAWALGKMAFYRGDYAEAARRYESIRQSWVYFPAYECAVAYLDGGEISKAVPILEKLAIRYEPVRLSTPAYGVLVFYQLGRAYEASGWPDRAIEQYQEFLRIWKDADPGLPEVAAAKERLKLLRESS